MKPRVLLSWSSGKDSAWCLHVLRQCHEVEVVGLVTTFDGAADRVAMHGVPRTLVEAQAQAAGLPLWPVPLPWPCPNADYEAGFHRLLREARHQGVTHLAFGDLFLEDIRAYRERLLTGTGVAPLFPLWCAPADTRELARTMLDAGLRAVLTCVDPRQLARPFVGREFDAALLADLPTGVDPCGENGEFHTFCYAGPMFTRPVPVRIREQALRGDFHFAEVEPVTLAEAGTGH